jgi:hypothetical protein
MKLITCYSDSHESMFDKYFLPSFNSHLSNYELKVKKLKQISSTGNYGSRDFNLTCKEKIRWILENFEIDSKEEVVYSDCDVQFFGKLDYFLGNNDILFQYDYNRYCTGFFIFKQTKTVLDFLLSVEKMTSSGMDDETASDGILKNHKIVCGILPKEKYWTIGSITKGNVWTGQKFDCPKEIIMHHANWTVGIPNKLLLLEIVKCKMEQHKS